MTNCLLCGRAANRKYCSYTCASLAKKLRRQDLTPWFRLQLEVAAPLSGRILGGSRRGRYADVESADHLIECKLVSARRTHIRPGWVEKIRELAARYRKHPVLVVAVGGLSGTRLVFFLDDAPEWAVKSWREFAPVLQSWKEEGHKYYMGGFSTGAHIMLRQDSRGKDVRLSALTTPLRVIEVTDGHRS